jgi:hypothetical protein
MSVYVEKGRDMIWYHETLYYYVEKGRDMIYHETLYYYPILPHVTTQKATMFHRGERLRSHNWWSCLFSCEFSCFGMVWLRSPLFWDEGIGEWFPAFQMGVVSPSMIENSRDELNKRTIHCLETSSSNHAVTLRDLHSKEDIYFLVCPFTFLFIYCLRVLYNYLRALVSTVMNFRIPQKAGNFLTSCRTS